MKLASQPKTAFFAIVLAFGLAASVPSKAHHAPGHTANCAQHPDSIYCATTSTPSSQVTVVPLPASLVLLLGAIGGLAAVRKVSMYLNGGSA